MGRFQGIGSAQVGGSGGSHFPPWGQFKVEVLKVITLLSRKKEDLFIVEVKVLESNLATCPPGRIAAQTIKFSWDSAQGDIKGFLAAGLGLADLQDTGKLKEFLAACGVETVEIGNRGARCALADVDDANATFVKLALANGVNALEVLWSAAGEAVVNEDPSQGAVNPFAGGVLCLETRSVQTRAKTDFTKHIWSAPVA